jgi:hypothetical protein
VRRRQQAGLRRGEGLELFREASFAIDGRKFKAVNTQDVQFYIQ